MTRDEDEDANEGETRDHVSAKLKRPVRIPNFLLYPRGIDRMIESDLLSSEIRGRGSLNCFAGSRTGARGSWKRLKGSSRPILTAKPTDTPELLISQFLRRMAILGDGTH